jgi:hypothetical protein
MLETENDRIEENKVTERICKAWKVESGGMGAYSPFDKYLYSGEILKAIIEIKIRWNRKFDSFPTVLMNLDKYITLINLEIYTKIPALYIVAFSDGIYYIKASDIHDNLEKLQIVVRGRKDREGVKNDIRPTIDVPLTLFTKIKE